MAFGAASTTSRKRRSAPISGLMDPMSSSRFRSKFTRLILRPQTLTPQLIAPCSIFDSGPLVLYYGFDCVAIGPCNLLKLTGNFPSVPARYRRAFDLNQATDCQTNRLYFRVSCVCRVRKRTLIDHWAAWFAASSFLPHRAPVVLFEARRG